MTPIILVVALLGSALGYPTVVEKYPPQCVDPTFACQDLQSARLCGVVKSCIHDIWSTMSVPDDNDDICTICKEMVKEARDQLLSNMTQEEIKEVFEGSCKLIPIKFVAEGCIKIVDEFIPELVDMLASRMDPNMVCTVSGLCNLVHLPIQKLKVKDDLTCEFCTHVLEHVKELITANTTVEEFRTALHNFCNHTGSFSSKCTEFVNEYFDEIFGFIKSLDTKGFCTLAGLCGSKSPSFKMIPMVKLFPPVEIRKTIPMAKLVPAHPVYKIKEKSKYHPLVKIQPPMSSNKKSNEIESNDIFAPESQLPADRFAHPSILFDQDRQCAFCKAISFYVKQDMNENRNKDNIELVFDNVCQKWVKEYPAYCDAVMQKYSVHMKQQIHAGADFDDVCSIVNACPVTDKTKDLNAKVVTSHNSSSVLCDVCKEVFDQIENLLKDPNTKQSVEKLIGQVCNNLPSSMRDECNKFIDDNLDQLFSIIEQELVPDNVCPAMRLCPAAFIEPHGLKRLRDIECDLCKDFVQQMQVKLQEPDTKTALKNLLEKGCSVLPQQIASKCTEFVSQNIDSLITILVQDMDPTLICSAIGICQNTIKVKKPINNEIECDFCKEIIEKVDEELKDQRTEEEIKEALHRVCSYLPQHYAVKCTDFVNTYSALLLSLLAQEMDPKTICRELKLCSDSLHQLKEKKVKDIECDLCKQIVEKLDDELKDKTTEEEIKAALEKVCKYFPSSISAKCVQFVETYADILIELIAEELAPDAICSALKICAGNSDTLQKQKEKVKNLECEGCQSFLHYMQNILMDSKVQEEMKHSIERVCKILPQPYEDNCVAYIDEYGSAMLAIIAQNIDPSLVCFNMNICPCNTCKPNNIYTKKEIKLDECALCKTVVDYLDQLLEEDDVDKEITALVEKVCTVVPSSLRERCSTIIEVYGPYLLQMIGQSLDSTQVCQDVDMCTRAPGHVHLLGGEKCTFGPSYWCQSKVHASACKAEMYCKQKVWLN